jgi:hypothetical protein
VVGRASGADAVVESTAEVLAMDEDLLDIGASDERDTEEQIEVAADAEELFETLREEWQSVDELRFRMDCVVVGSGILDKFVETAELSDISVFG